MYFIHGTAGVDYQCVARQVPHLDGEEGLARVAAAGGVWSISVGSDTRAGPLRTGRKTESCALLRADCLTRHCVELHARGLGVSAHVHAAHLRGGSGGSLRGWAKAAVGVARHCNAATIRLYRDGRTLRTLEQLFCVCPKKKT